MELSLLTFRGNVKRENNSLTVERSQLQDGLVNIRYVYIDKKKEIGRCSFVFEACIKLLAGWFLSDL